MKKVENVRVCDRCKKRVSDEGETYYGGHPFYGWYHVDIHGGPSDLASLRQQKEWDFFY